MKLNFKNEKIKGQNAYNFQNRVDIVDIFVIN